MERLTPETLKSLMQYGATCDGDSVTWQGYKIKFQCDECAKAPHDRSDCMAPVIWTYSRNGINAANGETLHRAALWNMDSGFVSRHWRKIALILGMSEAAATEAAQEYKRDTGSDLGNARQEVFAEELRALKDEATRGYREGHYLEALQLLFELQGVPAFLLTTRGYCQGDESRVLIVLTPEWAARVGCPYATPGKIDLAECERDAKGQLAELGAWMWGDVYGYTVTRKGRDVDSCWGFYGSDPIESGIAEAVCEAVNYAATKKAAKDAEKYAAACYAARPDLAPQWEGAAQC